MARLGIVVPAVTLEYQVTQVLVDTPEPQVIAASQDIAENLATAVRMERQLLSWEP